MLENEMAESFETSPVQQYKKLETPQVCTSEYPFKSKCCRQFQFMLSNLKLNSEKQTDLLLHRLILQHHDSSFYQIKPLTFEVYSVKQASSEPNGRARTFLVCHVSHASHYSTDSEIKLTYRSKERKRKQHSWCKRQRTCRSGPTLLLLRVFTGFHNSVQPDENHTDGRSYTNF